MHALRGRVPLRMLAVVGLLVLSPLAPVAQPASAPVARAADGSFVTGATTYTVQPTRRRVHATVELRVKNTTPDLYGTSGVTRYYFTAWSVGVQEEATNVRVTRGGVKLSTTVSARKGYRLVRFDLGPSLFYGQTAPIRIDYELPDGGARSKSPIRVGSAFATFYAFAYGDDQATVRIVFPAGYEVTTRGDGLTTSSGPKGSVLSTPASVDALEWYVVVTADRPAALRLETLRVPIAGEERIVEVRAWPEDDEWTATVVDELLRGLPALGGLTGLDWPVSGPLEVIEAYAPSLGGYAGFYTQGEEGQLDEIRVTEEPDQLVILHEAAHAWFNYDLFQGRWINEGLADEYAARVMRVLGIGAEDPEPVDRAAKEAFPLNAWPGPSRIEDQETDKQEQYGYDASWTVVRLLVAEVGEERMRDVLAAADAEEIAYAGRPRIETHTLLVSWTDWRYFLDLLQQRGGSELAAEVFRSWIVADADRAGLAEHEEAVTAYTALVERGDGWLPGHAIRSQLARWSFTAAGGFIADAAEVLDRRAEIQPLEATLGVDDDGALQESYEAATISYERSTALAEEELQTLGEMQDAARRVATEPEPLVAIGLIGEDPGLDVAAAAAAYRDRDLDAARAEAAEAMALIDGAAEVGTQRVAIGAAGAASVLVGGGFIVLLRRRRRTSALATAAAEGPATLPDHPAGEGQGEEQP